jgi:hypothetical protein
LDTSRDPERARDLKLAWCDSAVNRLRAGQGGHFGYSVFSVSRDDLLKLRDLHLEYLRAMLQVIRNSTSPDRVALYCVQLLDLDAGPSNVFGSRDDWGATARD